MDMQAGDGRCRIAIIGGGFTGAVVALNLLELLDGARAEIVIVEPRERLGCGLAYSAADPAHRVNVPAIRLLVHPDEPGAFHKWLESSGALVADPQAELPDGRRYPRRATFGGYVGERLGRAVARPGAPALRHRRAVAVGVAPLGGGYEVALDDGGRELADAVVLAVSHPAPSVPAPLAGVADRPKFFADPWRADIAGGIGLRDRILIVGTALSTADVVGTLDAMGHAGTVLAISRRGLVSRERRPTSSGPYGDFSTRPSRSAVALLRAARRAVREAPEFFGCWESVVEALRNQGQNIWTALPEVERKRFLRHLRPFWDVHRYQLAPQLGATVRAREAAGLLDIQAARLVGAAHDGARFHVTLRQREAVRPESFDAIINCTGPDHAHVTETNPALASLAAAGLLHPDVHRLGIETDMDSHPIDDAGAPARSLYVAGPLARASFGELMGLPQVTEHATRVARLVAQRVLVSQ